MLRSRFKHGGHFICTCLLFAGIATCIHTTASAQSLSGIVRSNDGETLPGVNVLIPALEAGTATDTEGNYTFLHLPKGAHQVVFSYVGYKTEEREVRIDAVDLVINVTLQPDIIQADEVLITDERAEMLTRSARSVSVLEAEALAEVRGQTLGETLEELPGVTTLKTGPSISKPVVRGLHSQRVLVLNAGVSQEGQQWGGEHAPEIDPFAPVRIEVVKGVAGVEYGVGAIGGVIRLEPLELPYVPGQGLGGELSLNGFSNNMQGAGALYLEGAANALPGFGWRVQGSFRKAGDAQAPDYVIANSGFQEFNGAVSAGFHRGPVHLIAHYSHFGTELGIFRGAHIGNVNDLLRAIDQGSPAGDADFGYEIGPPKQVISHDLFTVHGDYRLPGGAMVEGQYGVQANRRQEFDAHRSSRDSLNTSTKPSFDFSLISHTVELKYQHAPLGRFVGVVGVSGMNQLNHNDATGFLIPNFRAYSGGVFARESWVGEAWTLEAGTRLDYRWVRAWPRENRSSGEFVKRISDYMSVSGAISALWQFAPAWSVGVNLGTGWRPPSVNELYNFGVHHGTAQFEIGNPDLETERSIGLDATLRHDGPRSRFEFSVYNNWFDRFIYLFPDPEPRVTIRGTFPTFRYEQADARLRGMDASFGYTLTPFLALTAQAAIVRGDNLDRDEPLIYMPSDRLTLRTEFSLGEREKIKNTRLGFESVFVRRQDRFPVDVDYVDPPPGYTLFNANFTTQLMLPKMPVRLNLEIQNALNTVYRDYLSRFRYFIDDPGRSLIFRVQVPLGVHQHDH